MVGGAVQYCLSPNSYPLGSTRHTTSGSPHPEAGLAQGSLGDAVSSLFPSSLHEPRRGSFVLPSAVTLFLLTAGTQDRVAERGEKQRQGEWECRKKHVNISKIFFCHPIQYFHGTVRVAEGFPCRIQSAHSPLFPLPSSFRTV